MLPQGWVSAPIGDLCRLINGKAFKPSDWAREGLPIIRIQNLNRPDAEFNYCDTEVDERFLVEPGELLFAWSGTPGTSFGAHIWNGPKAILNQHIFRVRFDESQIDKEFFRRAINANLDELINKAHGGVGLAHVTKGKFEATEVVLPPSAEQHRIVAKLDALTVRLTRARAELGRVPQLAEQYKRAVLAEAFRGDLTCHWRVEQEAEPVRPRSAIEIRSKFTSLGSFDPPYRLPSTWEWLRLPELGDLDRGKSRHRPRNDARLFGGPYPFIQTGEVRQATRFLTSYSETYSDFGLAQSRLWPVGTVCITIAANIAETAILGIEACFPDSVVGFLADANRADPSYVEFFLRTARAELAAFAPATAQKNINLDTLANVRVPVPPMPEQIEIVRRVEAAFTRADRLECEAARARALLDRLEATILAKTFRGELVPQDPNDEPASVMVDRIRAQRSVAPTPPRGRKKVEAAIA
jgi:type I restriction enzyme, S subunit